jgi:hypothetical protein
MHARENTGAVCWLLLLDLSNQQLLHWSINMTDAQQDPQQQLEEMIAAQKMLEEQIKQQREVARQAALDTIKRLFESHAFAYSDVKGFIKAPTARKSAARKTSTTRKKRGT